jgi:hypothetical protein
MESINLNHVRKALRATEEIKKELEAILTDVEKLRPDPAPQPTRIRRSLRSGK